MSPDWNEQSIANAWQPFEATEQKPFDAKMAAHLLRRSAFGGTSREIDQLAELGVQRAVEKQLSPAEADAFDAEADVMIRTSLILGDTVNVIDWWLYRMQSDPHGVREKATFFWHGHFCSSRDKVPDAQLLLAQNNMLRENSLGSFEKLVKAISRDAAMLIYLDSTENRKNRPNENYARELLELFCLGLGNYTEQDIKELARCFTGWEVRRRRFRISQSDHDTGTKTVLGTTGRLDGDEAIDVVLQHPAAARFIAAKLMRYYVTDDAVPQSVIDSLAEYLVACDWQLEPVLRKIFSSQLFYSEACVGRKIASPVEWTMHWLRTLECTASLERLRFSLEMMGQVPLEPPNVKGWAGGTSWIDPSRMSARVNWSQRLAGEMLEPAGGLASWLGKHQLDSAEGIIAWMQENVLAVPLAKERQEILYAQVSSQKQVVDQFRVAIRVAGLLPEAHLI